MRIRVRRHGVLWEVTSARLTSLGVDLKDYDLTPFRGGAEAKFENVFYAGRAVKASERHANVGPYSPFCLVTNNFR